MLFGLSSLLFILIVVLLFVFILYKVEPSLVAIPFSLVLKLFLKNPPFVEVETYFPGHKVLEKNWQVIKEELLEILKQQQNIPRFHEVDNIQKTISASDGVSWRVFIFKAYDNWLSNNCKMAPKTTAILKEIPEVTTAMFSILEPRKRIPPHYGFYKGIYRYHLGMIIPKEGDCYLINGGDKYFWKEGEGVLFDDTFQHEVWNKSNELRVVLFCDVYRNDLPSVFKYLNKYVYKMRVKSKRLKKVAAKAEMPVQI